MSSTTSMGNNVESCSPCLHGSVTAAEEKNTMRNDRLAMTQKPGTDSFTDRYIGGASSYDHTATMREKLADLTPHLPSSTTSGSTNGSGNSS
ncbi:hypothetical protein F5Y11DRAFT_202036 [Daldinia sp. FL1419]|nr:hypothetical protein F5Y11DRAFT_202036 [Daldinia sp. FL1419]